MIKDLKWIKDFKCTRCHAYVCVESLVSGVRNRNHCPYCLWSKHLDLYQPGDRLSACQAGMQPVGLTLKRSLKKYGGVQGGELMLIHHCTGCGSISINRIAADDLPERICEVFVDSLAIDETVKARLAASGVLALGAEDRNLVRRRLFGESISSKMPPAGENYPFLPVMQDEI